MPDLSQFNIDRTYPGGWTITFSNPPINMFVPATIIELGALMTGLEADPSVKVVVFQSADPDFFIAHLDVAKAAERPEALGLWRDFVLRLSSTPVVSIAKIRGRTRGIGNEFVLACDMRFASRQSALFGNPEVGVGLVPGGGALEWLPRLVGRSRALEIVLSGDDFDADVAERYGWVNRTLDDDDLDSFVDTLVRRLASFDRETLAAAKAQVNRFGTPTATELQSSNDLFFPLLALPGAQARRAKVRNIGYGVRSDFELNFGRYLPRSGGRTTFTRILSPADRRPGFLNSAPTFYVRQRPLVNAPPNGDTRKSEVPPMEEHVIVDSSFSAIINAPLGQHADGPTLCRAGSRQTSSGSRLRIRSRHSEPALPFGATSPKPPQPLHLNETSAHSLHHREDAGELAR